jgi:mannitol/fructose-specific phosphotransferase system IIA component (Ntr-type)
MATTLSDMLTPEAIALNVRARDWRDAVRAAGALLVRADKVEPRYVDAMIRMSEDIGPYIVIIPGVALPHARPEDGVREACMSLVTLAPPVSFGNANNDPVQLVVAFGSTDNKAHLGALAELARLLGDADTVANMVGASSADQLLELVRRRNERTPVREQEG